MAPLLNLRFSDAVAALAAVMLFFGCIASSIRSAKTVEPGALSASISYIRAMNARDLNDEPGHFVPLEVRVGVTNGIDVGIQNTFDLTRDRSNEGATLWLDGKFQLTNIGNDIHFPIVSTGVMKGFLYNLKETNDVWSFPLMVSLPNESILTPTWMYRFELFSDSFFPDKKSWDNIRHSLTFGMEFELMKAAPHRQAPKIGLAVSWYNSYTGGEGADGLAVSIGFIF